MTAISSGRLTTPQRPREIIDPMMMSLHTHVALTYLREREQEHPEPRPYATSAASDRETVETAASVGSLRRRLAQMHLAPTH
jgi:uncharacterized membrane protein YccC